MNRADDSMNKADPSIVSTGLIHIYCGNGKGKTTAGMGLCVRAAGAGARIVICQFMKDNSSSERKILGNIDNITLMSSPEKVKFSFRMTDEEKAEQRAWYARLLEKAGQTALKEHAKVLFLDEAVYCVGAGLLSEDVLLEFLRNKPSDLEVILTGQNPGERLVEIADYVSEIKKVKHPFDRNIRARKGIEK